MDCPQRVDELSFRYAAYTRLTRTTAWPEKKSTMIAGRYCANWEFFTNRKLF